MLNEKTEATKRNIHLMVTSMCDRDCKYCCNKQYELNSIPYLTDDELSEADNIFITGGEPFKYANPVNIAWYLRNRKRNLSGEDVNVYVYSNAVELRRYLYEYNNLGCIYGLTISIKTAEDYVAFKEIVEWMTKARWMVKSIWVYYFDDILKPEVNNPQIKVIKREWQKEFVPDNKSIFRKL